MTLIALNKNWRFLLDDPVLAQKHNYWDKGYNDQQWKEVTIPHDWSVELPFSEEYSSGTGYLAGGIGWYRLHVHLPENLSGKKLWIEFDGIYKNSQVWCNSYYLGKWPNGYSTFRYDISEQVCFGDMENIIAVKVSHTDIADSRWFTGSGLYRKVSLIVQEQVYLEPASLFFNTLEVTKDFSSYQVELTIQNELPDDKQVEVGVLLEDMKGKIVKVLSETSKIEGNQSKELEIKGIIENPLLWSDRDPNLYRLVTTLSVDGKKEIVDSRNVGFRDIVFDPNLGMFVNGISTKLKGICLHHDAGCLGAAVQKNIWQRRLQKLKEMGSNAVRCAHNPHMPELYEICDELGFYVIDEAFDEWEGPKNKWSFGHNVYPPLHQGYYEEFPQWYEKDLAAMVLRDRNHPSVILWSIGNEIDYPNDPYCHPLFETMTGNNDKNKPTSERIYNPNKPNAERITVLAAKLTECVKKYDISRGVTLAAAYPELSTHIGFIDSLDVVGYNYKEEYYMEDHKRFPAKPFLGSECNHSLDAWKTAKNNDFISGQFLWTGIDYLGEAYGWPIHGSSAGLLTLAGFEKSGYWFRQSLWADEHVLSVITSREPLLEPYKNYPSSWNYVEGETVIIRAYTNCIEAECFINGNSIGRKGFDNSVGYIEWTTIYKTGELSIKAYNNDNQVIEQCIHTIQAACMIKGKVWDKDIIANGQMLVQIEVEVTDQDLNRCQSDETKLYVNVEGEGKLVGIENGNLSDSTSYNETYRSAYHGQLLIYIRTTDVSGNITVSIRGDGLQSESIAFASK